VGRFGATAIRLHRTLLNSAVGCSWVIIAVTAAYLVCGAMAFVAWRITADDAWVTEFFQVPAALAMLWLSATQFWLAGQAAYHFAAGEPMRRVWTWITLSAACGLAGTVSTQIFAVKSPLNPLMLLPAWRTDSALAVWHEAGSIIGGTLQFAFLACGLRLAVRVYRQAGFLGRLKWSDRALLIAFAAYLVAVVYDVAVAFRAGKPWRWSEAAVWPVDPLLWLLLLQALLLYRSVKRMGPGWIGRCWKTLSFAVFLTALGDVGTWAFNYGYLPYPWSAVVWYVWLPAAAAYALAPAYQLEAIHRATGSFPRG